MPKLNLSKKFDLVNSDRVKRRFEFIQDPILRSNINSAFQYIIFLLILEDEYDLSKVAKHYIYKDMIVHSAVIVEGLLHYKLKLLVDERKLQPKDLSLVEEKYQNIQILYKIDSESEVIAGFRSRTFREISDTEDFRKINDCAKRAKLLNKDLHLKAEHLRKLRNKIHVFALKDEDNEYNKGTIEQIFSEVNEIVETIST